MIFATVGHEFDIDDSGQLAKVLFFELRLDIWSTSGYAAHPILPLLHKRGVHKATLEAAMRAEGGLS